MVDVGYTQPARGTRTLGIDDARALTFCTVVARTFREGLKLLTDFGPWDVLYLDHDLAAVEIQYNPSGREYTGMDILNYLEQNPQYLPRDIEIISANASVKLTMLKLVDRLYGRDAG